MRILRCLVVCFFSLISFVVPVYGQASPEVAILVVDDFSGGIDIIPRGITIENVSDQDGQPIYDLDEYISTRSQEIWKNELEEYSFGCKYIVPSNEANEVFYESLIPLADRWYPNTSNSTAIEEIYLFAAATGQNFEISDEPILSSKTIIIENPNCGGKPLEEIVDVQNAVTEIIGELNSEGQPAYEALKDALEAEGDVTNRDLCIAHLPEYSTDGQGHFTTQPTDPDNPFSHGMTVMSTIQNVATDFEMPITGSPAEWRMDITVPDLSQTVSVEGLHVNGFFLETIENEIRSKVENSPKRWVINLSFAVIPCNTLITFEVYQGLLKDERQVQDLGKLLFELYMKFYSDEVANVLPPIAEECATSPCFLQDLGNAISVAAAGNLGLEYPYYPAAFPNVVSVSATPENTQFNANPNYFIEIGCAQDTTLDLCSNGGEVKMPGLTTYEGWTLAGTSYAAPRMSFRVAIYLMLTNGTNLDRLLYELKDPIDPEIINPTLCQLRLRRNEFGKLKFPNLYHTGPAVFRDIC